MDFTNVFHGLFCTIQRREECETGDKSPPKKKRRTQHGQSKISAFFTSNPPALLTGCSSNDSCRSFQEDHHYDPKQGDSQETAEGEILPTNEDSPSQMEGNQDKNQEKADLSICDIGDSPHQPLSFAFPKRTFGIKTKVQRSFQAAWFKDYSWLHYVEDGDKVLCHICTKAYKTKQLSAGKVDLSFITKGYTNWKMATTKSAGFAQHQSSECHKEAVSRTINLPSTQKDIGECLFEIQQDVKSKNRKCLLQILSNIRFLARQGLALRGDGDETNSNFMQLFSLTGMNDPNMKDWLHKKTNKYTHAAIQNEMLETMAL